MSGTAHQNKSRLKEDDYFGILRRVQFREFEGKHLRPNILRTVWDVPINEFRLIWGATSLGRTLERSVNMNRVFLIMAVAHQVERTHLRRTT